MSYQVRILADLAILAFALGVVSGGMLAVITWPRMRARVMARHYSRQARKR